MASRLGKSIVLPAGILAALLAGVRLLPAQSVSDSAVRVSAVVQASPPSITLSWPGDPSAYVYDVYRKARDSSLWNTVTQLTASATGFVDTNVATGTVYEYWISKTAPTMADGFILAGIQAPLQEARGKVVLLVDNTWASALTTELARLQWDLAGDGWQVIRHDVARMAADPADLSTGARATRSNELAGVKALIQGDYAADKTNVKAVLLLGRIPVPYSGDIYPDMHPEHRGAWPADVFYADMEGTWTDSTVTRTSASDPRNRNVPDDGKFDQVLMPAVLALQIGRVDFANMPSFPQGEGELLRQYLNKEHNFRHGLTVAARRGLIADQLGLSTGEPFAANGWRNFAPFFGANNTVPGDWLSTLRVQDYLWGYGCGGGTFTSASGVATTSQLVSSDPRVIFTMLFGSWFGDWDSQDNLLRAAICTTNYTLTSAWAGRPFWYFHHMGLGETVGFSARATQNNDGSVYAGGGYTRFVHVALMGDPTLRMHVVAPASALVIATNGTGGVDLNWAASPDTVLGYNVYRAATAAGPFARLNTDAVTGTIFADPLVSSNVYMVRAVKLEVSGSGSYTNASQGIFQSLDSSLAAPSIVLTQPGSNAVFGAPATIQLETSTFDYANAITNVEFYADGVKVGETNVAPFRFRWTNVPIGTNSLTARAIYSGGLATTSSPVMVAIRQTLTITAQNTNKLYGAPLPAFTAAYSGFINGDMPASLSSPAVFSTTANAGSSVGTYPINASGAAGTNYYIVFVPGTLIIQPAATAAVVTSSTNPAPTGQPVIFTATLTAVAPGAGTPSGAVQFKIDGTNAGAPVTLSGGVAQQTNSTLAHGFHTVGAAYGGTANFTGTTNWLSSPQLINSPPVAAPVTILRDPASGTKVSIATLLSGVSDADLDPVLFAGAGPNSTNGGTVVTNAGWIFYSPVAGFTNVDAFPYTINDGYVTSTGQVTVNVRVDNGPSPNLAISGQGSGMYLVRGDGIPARVYRLEYADEVPPVTNWQVLGSALADPFGVFQWWDTNGTAQRFYRSVNP
jgi:hypothetical protein